jgi:hypothetical protein
MSTLRIAAAAAVVAALVTVSATQDRPNTDAAVDIAAAAEIGADGRRKQARPNGRN